MKRCSLLIAIFTVFIGCYNSQLLINHKDFYYSYSDLSHRTVSVIFPDEIKLEGACSNTFNDTFGYPFKSELNYKQFIMENLQSYFENFMELSCVDVDTISYINEAAASSGSNRASATIWRADPAKLKSDYALYIKSITLFDVKELQGNTSGTMYTPYSRTIYDCLIRMNFEFWNLKTSIRLFDLEITEKKPFDFFFYGTMIKNLTKKVIQDFAGFMKKGE
jgi:hypothetical protein